MQSRLLKLLFVLTLLISGSASAVDTVNASSLADAKARCEAANMTAKVTLPAASRYYRVECVDRPPTLMLGRFTEAKAVAQCVRLNMDALIEVRQKGFRVSCVVPVR